MKKAFQKLINEEVLETYELFVECKDKFGMSSYGQLRSCSAWVYRTYGYIVLKSYNTVVAVIDTDNYVCYDFLRYVYGYTNTSSQHISKFAKDYGAVKTLSWKEV